MSNQTTNTPTPAPEQAAAKPVSAKRPAEDTIDLVELFYALWSKAWIIAVGLILGAVIAFTYTKYRVTPLYNATAKLYIVSSSKDSVINLSDLQIGTQLTYDYQELIKSRPLLEGVIAKLSLDMDPRQLAGMISVNNANGTRILVIRVTHPDPQKAQIIANELISQTTVYLPEVMGTVEPHIVETALLPTSKASPNTSRNTMMGAMLGAILVAGFFTIRFLMDDTLKTQDDVFKYLGIQPLATIPEVSLGERYAKNQKKSVQKKTSKKKPGGSAR